MNNLEDVKGQISNYNMKGKNKKTWKGKKGTGKSWKGGKWMNFHQKGKGKGNRKGKGGKGAGKGTKGKWKGKQ